MPMPHVQGATSLRVSSAGNKKMSRFQETLCKGLAKQVIGELGNGLRGLASSIMYYLPSWSWADFALFFP